MAEPRSLDEATLLEEARGFAGLDDFGSEAFRPHLRALLRALDREAQLHATGRATQHARIVDSLVARLRAQDWFARHPEILDEELGPPLVIVGLARTGTTRLHRLLSCDPVVHTAAWWELRAPSPTPGADPSQPDPRIAEAKCAVEGILASSPVMAAIHPWDHAGADEEILLLEHAFLSHVPESSGHVPSYRRYVDRQDLMPAYVYLRRMLQFLQWQKQRRGERAERWVLKSPFHLGYLETLFAVFPGAQVIQTHRDPMETVASAASMYAALWELAADDVDRHEVGRQVAERFAWALERCLRWRAQHPDAFHDVGYQEVGRDPLAEIRRIYAFARRPFSPQAEAAMQRWLQDNARENRPPHPATLEDFGLSRSQIERDFGEYRERFILSPPTSYAERRTRRS